MSRSALNYSDVLLDDVAAGEINRMVNLSLPVMQTVNKRAACLTQCQYIEEHRKLWATLLTGGAAATVKEELLRISRELAATTTQAPKNQLPRELNVILTVTAMIEVLSWWLRQDEPLPAAKVASYIHKIIIA